MLSLLHKEALNVASISSPLTEQVETGLSGLLRPQLNWSLCLI
jgi:hypothetical protein